MKDVNRDMLTINLLMKKRTIMVRSSLGSWLKQSVNMIRRDYLLTVWN